MHGSKLLLVAWNIPLTSFACNQGYAVQVVRMITSRLLDPTMVWTTHPQSSQCEAHVTLHSFKVDIDNWTDSHRELNSVASCTGHSCSAKAFLASLSSTFMASSSFARANFRGSCGERNGNRVMLHKQMSCALKAPQTDNGHASHHPLIRRLQRRIMRDG